ncbi:MAG: creatininase family protein [Lentisphaeria bacterium]|nr:creatininase family protein [Lentisphaeria bacterium]NQZ71310.1 creatininase family protein [Lentisphaeria bacterium]
MGIYTDQITNEVRLEYMMPTDIDAALDSNPSIYVPFGSIEWHGLHNTVGLDSVKAHEQLIGLALKAGGVVYPSVFFGSGGRHKPFPHTYMVDKDPMVSMVFQLLEGFDRNGYKNVILLSGHYPNRGEYLEEAIERYRDGGGEMRIMTRVECEIDGVGGDHAAKYETSSMMFLHPECVDMSRIDFEPKDDGGPEERIDYMPPEYKDHPLYGLVGIDPRVHATVECGRQTAESLIDFFADWLKEA